MKNNLTEIIWKKIKMLPVFTADDLVFAGATRGHLNIILSRWSKSGKIFRLKKGIYGSADFLREADKKRILPAFTEYAANAIYPSSYLSLEYVLYGHNILTDMPKNFTSVSLGKTAVFSNIFGRYIYHKIKKDLFLGFTVENISGLAILKASRAKALFDYLYLRKNILADEKAVRALRLDPDGFTAKDRAEFDKYLRLEGSEKLKKIAFYLWKH